MKAKIISGFSGANGEPVKHGDAQCSAGCPPDFWRNARLRDSIFYKRTEKIKQTSATWVKNSPRFTKTDVIENIRFFGGSLWTQRQGKSGRKVNHLIDLNGLKGESKKLVGHFPVGMEAKTLPSSGDHSWAENRFLDAATRGGSCDKAPVLGLIYEANPICGITIFVTTSFMDEAEYCNRISIW